jgi:hypothetical protein
MKRSLKLLSFALALGTVGVLLALATPAMAATTLKYHATFVENGAGQTSCAPGTSCGSATISELGHVAFQSIVFNACGPNCNIRTITFDDGSTLLIQESIVNVISPGNSSAAGTNAPLFLEISQTILPGGTGIFAGATGSGTGRVNVAAGAIITASGTITLTT